MKQKKSPKESASKNKKNYRHKVENIFLVVRR